MTLMYLNYVTYWYTLKGSAQGSLLELYRCVALVKIIHYQKAYSSPKTSLVTDLQSSKRNPFRLHKNSI